LEGREVGTKQRRPKARRWSVEYLVLTAMLMMWEGDTALQDNFAKARECLGQMFPGRKRCGRTYQGLVKAQRRLSPEVQHGLWDHLRGDLRRVAGSDWHVHGWLAFAADGSRVEVPRTRQNESLGCAGKKKTGPQLFVTTLYHMGMGLPWDGHIGKGTESERDHLRVMLANLPPGSLIVADAGFTGYELLTELQERGLWFLIRAGANVTLLENLGYATQLQGRVVWLWPQAKRDRRPLRLRLIRLVRVSDTRQEMCLITNVFDEQRLSDAIALRLYEMRWGVEICYRSYKQTLEQRKLRSDAPEQARWELFWGMTALLLLGLMSLEALLKRRARPEALSIAASRRIVRQAMSTSACWRRRGNLQSLLAFAVKDAYPRHTSKKARDWPFKKREQQAGLPRIRPATEKESQKAAKLYDAA
jgi:hypothetical protein